MHRLCLRDADNHIGVFLGAGGDGSYARGGRLRGRIKKGCIVRVAEGVYKLVAEGNAYSVFVVHAQNGFEGQDKVDRRCNIALQDAPPNWKWSRVRRDTIHIINFRYRRGRKVDCPEHSSRLHWRPRILQCRVNELMGNRIESCGIIYEGGAHFSSLRQHIVEERS